MLPNLHCPQENHRQHNFQMLFWSRFLSELDFLGGNWKPDECSPISLSDAICLYLIVIVYYQQSYSRFQIELTRKAQKMHKKDTLCE